MLFEVIYNTSILSKEKHTIQKVGQDIQSSRESIRTIDSNSDP